MKFKIIKIFIVIAISLSFLYKDVIFSSLNQNATYAYSDLIINWGHEIYAPDPIITLENMMPGDTHTKSITITNTSLYTRTISTKLTKENEINNLSQSLSFQIFTNSTSIYGSGSSTNYKSLDDAFIDSNMDQAIILFTLNPNESKTIDLFFEFNSSATNQYQSGKVQFSISIGISIPTPDECKNMNLDGILLIGSSKKDTLIGSSKSDLIFGLEGNDLIDGKDGNDCIVGGDGKNNLIGGLGNDTILAGSGNDTILAGCGDDTILAGDGNNSIKGDCDNDYIVSGIGNDSISGGAGNDEIYSGKGKDSINGDAGNDLIYAGEDNDSINGGTGDDYIDAGLSSEINMIIGGSGFDICKNSLFTLSCESN